MSIPKLLGLKVKISYSYKKELITSQNITVEIERL